VIEADSHRWRQHPAWARLVRWGTAAAVSGTVLGVTWLEADRLPRWHGWAIGLRAVCLLATSVALLTVLERAGRRLLPLAMLLELSVSFPDRLPRRFSLALRAANSRRLYRQLAEDQAAAPTAKAAMTRAVLMLGALAAHDRRTRGHCERVRALNDLMAEELGLEPEERERLRWAALLHDIGKLEVPARILNKPSAPSAGEWHTLRLHPEHGDHMIEPLRPWLGQWADAVAHHHERWDGTGYPHRLAGREISLAGRIVAVVDAYEVMTAVRPYQRPVGAAAARAELVRSAGSHFDPALVRSFLNISIGRLRRTIGLWGWLAEIPLVGAVPRIEVAAGTVARQSLTTVAAATGTTAAATALAVAASLPTPAVATGSSAGAAPAAAASVGVAASHLSSVASLSPVEHAEVLMGATGATPSANAPGSPTPSSSAHPGRAAVHSATRTNNAPSAPAGVDNGNHRDWNNSPGAGGPASRLLVSAGAAPAASVASASSTASAARLAAVARNQVIAHIERGAQGCRSELPPADCASAPS
jgi:putative nucleotidyltransferase with HDIG domain